MITRDLLSQLRELLRPMRTQIANVVQRATVGAISDTTTLQSLQVGVQAGQDLDEAERFQEYGFTSVPVAGAEAVVVCPSGDTGIPLVVAVDDRRHRPRDLESGEVALYEPQGVRVKLLANGDVEITAKSAGSVRASAGGATGPVVPHADYAAHTHPTGVGPSGPPNNAATAKTSAFEAE